MALVASHGSADDLPLLHSHQEEFRLGFHLALDVLSRVIDWPHQVTGLPEGYDSSLVVRSIGADQ